MPDDRTKRNQNIEDDADRMSNDEDIMGRGDDDDFEDVDELDDDENEDEGIETE